jgi:hypothetical protein
VLNRKKKTIDLNYVIFFNYEINVITKLDVFKDCMDTTNIGEPSLRFGIH